MAAHAHTKNPGFLSLAGLPDQHIVGAVIVMMDDAGEYHTQFVPGDLDGVPHPEAQERIGGWTSTAFEIANLGGDAA